MQVTRSNSKGRYIVAESIDCGGKGTIIDSMKRHDISCGLNVFDLREFWRSDSQVPPENNPLLKFYKTDDILPDFKDLLKRLTERGESIDTLIVCEPTWAEEGLLIRKKITHTVEGRKYTARETAERYSVNRHKLVRQVKVAREMGINTLCERAFPSSMIYQSSMDNPLSEKEIMDLPGNAYAAQNAPDVFVICSITAETAMKRLAERKKQDNCKFEVPEFQRKISFKYSSPELKAYLNSLGSKVVYVNTDEPTTLKETERAALLILQKARDGTLADGARYNFQK